MSNEYRGGGRGRDEYGRDEYGREEPRLDLRIEPPPMRGKPAAATGNPYDRAPPGRPPAAPVERAPAERAAPQYPPSGRIVEAADDEDDGDLAPPPYGARDYGREDYGREGDYDEAPRRRRTRWAPVVIAALALVGFAAVVWYAYDWGSGNTQIGAPPVIQADGGEIKTKPDAEGGIEVPNQDATILNPDNAEPQAEVLLPPPEEPVTPPPAPAAPVAAAPAPQPDADLEPGTEEGMGDIGELVEQEVPSEEPVAAAAPPSPPPASAVPAPATEPAAAEPAAGAPTPLVPAPAAAAPTAPAPATPAPATPQPTVGAGNFLIQLAALTSPDAAKAAWAKMQQKHPGLLGDMTLVIQEIDIEGKGKFYRVQAGPLPNRATADDLCAQLKAQKQDCIVVKR